MGKKTGVNKLADSDFLQFHQMVFRCGWATKNLHSAFDYIFNSPSKDSQCGKILSEWTKKVDGVLVGGYPPNSKDIKSDKEKLLLFTKHLFFHQEKHAIDPKVLGLMVGSIIFWDDQFKEVVQQNPANKTDHPYLNYIEKAKIGSGIVYVLNQISLLRSNFKCCILIHFFCKNTKYCILIQFFVATPNVVFKHNIIC